jgi:hypothetical protein
MRNAVLLAAFLLATPAAGGEAQDRLFAPGALDAVPAGAHLVFSHTRTGSFDTARLPAIPDGALDLGMAPDARAAEITLTEGGEVRSRATLPAENPVLLVFLETSLRSMAALTGGSPFYIRNRMREALAQQDAREPATIDVAGEARPGERLVFRPFADDPNRARMGAFADLELSVVLSDAVPGRFARLEAATGPGPDGEPVYAEAFEFQRMED